MNKKLALGLTLGVFIFVISCNIPGMTQPSPAVSSTETATVISLTTFTSTPIPPSLSVKAKIPCRAGPAENYDLIVTLDVADKVEIVGKADTFWIVKSSTGIECWVVADQQVTTEGDVSVLPIVAAPPTPAPTVPNAPGQVGLLNQKCSIDNSSGRKMFVNEFRLTWVDLSNNEDGFRIYRDGNLVAEVEADRTDVIDVIVAKNNRVHLYYVEAYNEVGGSKSEGKNFSCGK